MLKGVYSWCFGALCLGRACLNWFLSFLSLVICFFFFWVGVWIPKRGQRGFLSTAKSFKMVVFPFIFLSHISSGEDWGCHGEEVFQLCGFKLWGLGFVRKDGAYWLWGCGVDVRTKKCWHMAVGLGFVFVLVSFNSFSSKAALQPGVLRDARRDRVRASKNLSIYGGAQKKRWYSKNGLGAIGDLFWTGWVFHFNYFLSVLGVIGLVWNWFFINWGLFSTNYLVLFMFWIVLNNSYFFLPCPFYKFLIRMLLMNFMHVACSCASYCPWGFIFHGSWSAFMLSNIVFLFSAIFRITANTS